MLFLTLFFVALGFSYAYLNSKVVLKPVSRAHGHLSMTSMEDDNSAYSSSSEQPRYPSRNDVCRVFVTGVIGMDIKESYLSNDHFVINFPIAVIGHFAPVHDWEKVKTTETMWIGVEIWDSEAKRVIETYTKGSRIAGMAILMHNKWKDKVTGEDKKQFKLRMTKVMKEEEVNDFLGDIIEEEPSSGITDNYDYGANNEQQQAYDTPQQTYDTRQQQQQQQTRRPAAPARMVPPRYSPRNTGGNSEIPF